MLYYILRPIAIIAYQIYFRKIHLIDIEKVPKDRPLLIACNHPNGFTEPCVLSCFFPISLHFMTRGDLFKTPIMRMFLKSTHQIPIFRFRDGFEAMRNNQKNLGIAYKSLSENKAIIIFIEGSTKSDRKLRRFQKGLARMTKDYKKEYPDSPLGILPVTINFSQSTKPDSHLTVRVYDVIEPTELGYGDDISEMPENTLTSLLYDTMKASVFHMDDNTHESLYNKVLPKLSHAEYPNFYPRTTKSPEFEKRGLHIIELFKNENLISDLKRIANSSSDFVGKIQSSSLQTLLYYFLAPFALVGYLLNFIPVQAATKMTHAKVKKPIFLSSVLIALSVGAYALFIPLMLLTAWSLGISILYFILIFIFSSLSYIYFIYLTNKRKAIFANENLTLEEKESIHKINTLLNATT